MSQDTDHYESLQFEKDSQLDLDNKQLVSAARRDEKVTNLNECSAYSKTVSAMIIEENLYRYKFLIPEFSTQLLKNLAIKKSPTNKIPYKIFHVWITPRNSPREINQADIKNIIKNKEIFDNDFTNGTNKWEHILWTNGKGLIPNSTRSLEKSGIEVKSIDNSEIELSAINKINTLIESSKLREATYLLRYNIAKHYGGVYTDVNFKFERSIMPEMHKYDFFAPDFVGYFFAVKANHSIISNAIDFLERNLVTPPAYINSVDSYNNSFVKDMLTYTIPLGLAYLNSSNKGPNVDIIYPAVGINSITIEVITWLDERKCLAFWEFYNFGDSLGICGASSLLIGNDGADHMK